MSLIIITMNNLETRVNDKKPGSWLVEPIEMPFKDEFITADIEDTILQFRYILRDAGGYLKEFISDRYKCLDLEHISYYSIGGEELQKIFPAWEDEHDFTKLSVLDEVFVPLNNIYEMLHELPDSIACLEEMMEVKHSYTLENDDLGDRAQRPAYTDDDIRTELNEINGNIRGLFEEINTLQSLLADKEAIWNSHKIAVQEFGEERFIKGILGFLRDEYGYDDLVASLMELASLDEIHEKLTTVKARDLPLSDLYSEVTQKMKEGSSRQQLSHLHKRIREETREMKGELLHFAEYFKPSLTHYYSLEKACKELLVQMEKRFTKDEFTYNERILVADSTFLPEIDFKAGAVSRDCTERRPLPFYHPQVHNMKLYFKDKPDKYIGNVYLIEGEAPDASQNIHIEAFQCPYFTSTNASDFLEAFLPNLKNAYEKKTGKKGVIITMNKQVSHKSNQAPIRIVMKSKSIGESFKIQYPYMAIRYGFSSFQGGKPGAICEKEILYR